MFFCGLNDFVDRLLDSNIDHVIAVIAQNDVDEVLPDVVHIATDGGEHHRALSSIRGLFHVGFEERHRGLHDFSGLQHKGQLHFAGGKALADHPHALQEVVVDQLKGSPAVGECLLQVLGEALCLTVDDAAGETLGDREGGELRLPLVFQRLGVDAFKQLEHALQRVIADVTVLVVFTPIPDQIEGNLALFIRDLRERHDFGGIDDCSVEAGFGGLVQEHRVQDGSGRGVQPKRHVGDPEGGVNAGVEAVDLPNRFDGFDGVAAGLFLTGRNREGEAVDNDVVSSKPPYIHQSVDQPACDSHLVGGCPSLALFVDGECDDRRPVFFHKRHGLRKTRRRAIPVFEVHRVDHGPATDEFQAGLHDGRLRRIDHKRQGGRLGKPRNNLGDVGHPVPADVVHADI